MYNATVRVAEILDLLFTDDFATVGEYRDELATVLPLLGLERFDRRGLNRALARVRAVTE